MVVHPFKELPRSYPHLSLHRQLRRPPHRLRTLVDREAQNCVDAHLSLRLGPMFRSNVWNQRFWEMIIPSYSGEASKYKYKITYHDIIRHNIVRYRYTMISDHSMLYHTTLHDSLWISTLGRIRGSSQAGKSRRGPPRHLGSGICQWLSWLLLRC